MEDLGKLLGTLLEASYNCLRHDVFVDYFPHVNNVDVRIYKNRWSSSKQNDEEKFEINLDNDQASMKIRELTKYINHIGGN